MNSIDKKWVTSDHYKKAFDSWFYDHTSGDDFIHSVYFRNARLAFRRDVNQSWEIEST